MLVHGRIHAAIRYLEDKKGWSAESESLMSRRKKEVAILEAFLKEQA
jgi:hypothetical protein